MKARVFLAVVFAGVAAAGAAAQEGGKWYNSYAPGIDQSKIFINAGIGWGVAANPMVIPPITVSADFKLPVKVPITVGGLVGFRTSSYSQTFPRMLTGYGPAPGYEPIFADGGDATVTFTDLALGVRGNYHFNFVKKLDVYAGLTLGYVIQMVDYDVPAYYKSGFESAYPGASWVMVDANLGARYFFTDMLGVYLEFGIFGFQIASIGLSLKF